MNKTILLSCWALLMGSTLFAQNPLLKEYEQKWTNAKKSTLELATSMPEEHFNFKPTEEQMTFKSQLLHMVGNMNWLCSSYLGGEKIDADLKNTEYSKAEVLSILEKGFDLSLNAVKNLSTEQLEEKVEFFAGEMSKRQILTLMNDHLTHHRGQAIIYLRLKGVKPPRYVGW